MWYRRSTSNFNQDQKYFVYQGATSACVNTLISGVFMSGYILWLGASESITGLIAAVPMLMSILRVQVSTNGITWTDVGYSTYVICDTDTYYKDVLVLNTPTSGRYVRLIADTLSSDNFNYYLQIAELAIEKR